MYRDGEFQTYWANYVMRIEVKTIFRAKEDIQMDNHCEREGSVGFQIATDSESEVEMD